MQFIVTKRLPKPPAPPAARASDAYAIDEVDAGNAVDEVPAPAPESPTAAFDQLYELHARPLMRQTFLLCGHRRVARRAVGWAFHRAWERWPEVAAASDPEVWVRAAAYEYALSPWHQLLPGRRRPEAYAGRPEDRTLLDALLRLPRSYRAALLLSDGLGLSLADTAAETQASAGATAGRITHAREALAEDWPELRETAEDERDPLLARRLRELLAAQPVQTSSPPLVRRGSEHTTRRWVRASLGLTAAVTAATTFTLLTAEEPTTSRPEEPGPRQDAPSTVPSTAVGPRGVRPETVGPQASGVPAEPSTAGRSERALPGPGDPAAAATHAYLPQLRSTNERMHLKDFKKSAETSDSEGSGNAEVSENSEDSDDDSEDSEDSEDSKNLDGAAD